jgi:hypothetical protein
MPFPYKPPLPGQGSRIAKISVVVTIAVAFLRAVYGPVAGLGAIEFWLLLFFAAATNVTVSQRPLTVDQGPQAQDER